MLLSAPLFTAEYIGQMLATAFVFSLLLGAQTFIQWARAKKVRSETDEKLKAIESKVDDTKFELSPNGGSSTRDVINRIHDKLDRVYSDIALLSAHLTAIVPEIRAKLEIQMNMDSTARYIANELGDIEFVNQAMIELFGMNGPHLMKRKRFNCVETQEEKMKVHDAVVWNVKNKEDYSQEYIIVNRKTKDRIQVCEAFEPVYDKDGKFERFVGSISVIKKLSK